MKTIRWSLKSLLVVALVVCGAFSSALAADWIYSGSYITNSLGWKIQVSATGTNLATIDNGGMIKGYPAVADRTDGRWTLDLSGTITNASGTVYTLTTIGYYAFNGGCNIGTLILPETVTTWKLGDATVGVFGRQGAGVDTVLPKDFSHDITWTGSPFNWGASSYKDEVHMKSVTSTGNCGLTFTHGGVQRIFFYEPFATIHSTTFANSGSTKYDLYFRGGLPTGIDDGGYSLNGRALIHVPQTESWTTWLADHTREFADSDKSTFETRYPGYDYPLYVITSGKFINGYATYWNADPGITVDAAVQVGASEITPAYGSYSNVKTGRSSSSPRPRA